MAKAGRTGLLDFAVSFVFTKLPVLINQAAHDRPMPCALGLVGMCVWWALVGLVKHIREAFLMRDTEQGKIWGSQTIQTVIRGCIDTFSPGKKSLTYRFSAEKSGEFLFGPFKNAVFRPKFPGKTANQVKKT